MSIKTALVELIKETLKSPRFPDPESMSLSVSTNGPNGELHLDFGTDRYVDISIHTNEGVHAAKIGPEEAVEEFLKLAGIKDV